MVDSFKRGRYYLCIKPYKGIRECFDIEAPTLCSFSKGYYYYSENDGILFDDYSQNIIVGKDTFEHFEEFTIELGDELRCSIDNKLQRFDALINKIAIKPLFKTNDDADTIYSCKILLKRFIGRTRSVVALGTTPMQAFNIVFKEFKKVVNTNNNLSLSLKGKYYSS